MVLDAGMERAWEIFGTTFGICCRNLPPLKGQERQKLLHGDIVHVVDVDSSENIQLNEGIMFKEFIAAQGVELVYECRKSSLFTLY
jgi:hypothetical protein